MHVKGYGVCGLSMSTDSKVFLKVRMAAGAAGPVLARFVKARFRVRLPGRITYCEACDFARW